jgi:hypothetical protein
MQKERSNNDVSSILLIVFIIITFVTNVSIALIQSSVDNWYNMKTVTVVLLCLQILRNVSYILPALAIKNKIYKIIGVALSSIMVVYLLCSPIIQILENR